MYTKAATESQPQRWEPRVVNVILMVLAVFALAACSADADVPVGESASATSAAVAEEADVPAGDSAAAIDASASEVPAPVAASDVPADGASGPSVVSALPDRPGPRRQTTGSVPHIQTDAAPVASVNAELKRLVFLLPGVEERESARSLPGAAGLWLGDSLELARGDVLGDGREMAHIHPDGSLHMFLPVELAIEVEETKWGELHPWAVREGFWNGLAMVYTPETMEEVEVALSLVVASYNFVVGADIVPTDLG